MNIVIKFGLSFMIILLLVFSKLMNEKLIVLSIVLLKVCKILF